MKEKWKGFEFKTKLWIIAGIAAVVIASMIWG